MITNTQDFIDGVEAHAGIRDTRVERVVRIVLSTIGAHLSPAQRGFIADELPPDLGANVRDGIDLAAPLEERVVGCGFTVGQAHELIASACRGLADGLSVEALRVLAGTLPTGLAALLVPGSHGASRPLPGRMSTLAEGRPGGGRPIAEAGASRVQTGSIAADNPHAETKLSSGVGTTQERLHETLAEGRSGSEHPFSRSRG